MGQFSHALESIDSHGALIHLRGNLDAHASPELLATLRATLNTQNQLIVVDMDELEFIDSSGIATLAEGLAWSRHSGGRFVLAGIRPRIMDVLSLARLDTVFEIVPDCESALSRRGDATPPVDGV